MQVDNLEEILKPRYRSIEHEAERSYVVELNHHPGNPAGKAPNVFDDSILTAFDINLQKYLIRIDSLKYFLKSYING